MPSITRPNIEDLRVKLFADGADLASILTICKNPWIQGFTTNPTLMRKAGILDYEAFARNLLCLVPDRPVSLEVFADDEESMEAQARAIASWGPNVNVKIPVTNQQGVFMGPLIRRLSARRSHRQRHRHPHDPPGRARRRRAGSRNPGHRLRLRRAHRRHRHRPGSRHEAGAPASPHPSPR